MPVSKERYAENQRARRLAARPCQICGEKGAATEKHTAAPGAAVVRCCQPCYSAIAGLPDSPVAPIESQPDEDSEYAKLANILMHIVRGFRPADMPDMADVPIEQIIYSRGFIYYIALEGMPTEDAFNYAKEKATSEVAREQAQAQAQAEIDNGEPFYIRLEKPDNSEIPNIPIRILPPIQIPPENAE